MGRRAAYVCVKLLQSCPSLWDPVDCSLPSSFVHGILQARILEWVAMPSSKGPITGMLQARTLEWIAISFSNA